MVTVSLRFYEELNDFLTPRQRKVRFQKQLILPTTVKDLIESCGVPHTEVDLILVNRESVSFDQNIKDGDDVSVYPVFEVLDISDVTHLQGRPLRQLRFVVDAPLGKLARRLRLLGLDVAFDKQVRDKVLVKKAVNEKRILLTRNRQLLMFNVIQHGYCVRSDQQFKQVIEVVRRFDLARCLKPFIRCTKCNGHLKEVSKEAVLEKLEPLTKRNYNEFYQCQDCEKIYWPGSHYQKLKLFIDRVRKETGF